ncbi:Uncharacterised protein [Vibrio cholerae]|nr:Uncharacterised protein [Vibrio cholerae]
MNTSLNKRKQITFRNSLQLSNSIRKTYEKDYSRRYRSYSQCWCVCVYRYQPQSTLNQCGCLREPGTSLRRWI